MILDLVTVTVGVALGIVIASAVDALVLAWVVKKLKRWWERG